MAYTHRITEICGIYEGSIKTRIETAVMMTWGWVAGSIYEDSIKTRIETM